MNQKKQKENKDYPMIIGRDVEKRERDADETFFFFFNKVSFCFSRQKLNSVYLFN